MYLNKATILFDNRCLISFASKYIGQNNRTDRLIFYTIFYASSSHIAQKRRIYNTIIVYRYLELGTQWKKRLR
jgi:hypothetical protein